MIIVNMFKLILEAYRRWFGGVQKKGDMTLTEVSTQIRGYVRKWGTGWGVTTIKEVYGLRGIEEVYKLFHLDLKAWLINKNPRDVCYDSWRTGRPACG